jgi:S-adenosylmethionine decarboxylase
MGTPVFPSVFVHPPGDFFEGPEKKLEIEFTKVEGESGVRKVPRYRWDEMLADCQCSILNVISHEVFDCDAYLLSESSMFVMPHKLVIKTCGTTTLLNALPHIFEFCKEYDLEIEWLAYSREKFKYPQQQRGAHKNFTSEVEFLDKFCRDRGIPPGYAYVMGPLNGDHWNIYLCDLIQIDGTLRYDRGIDVKMYDLPQVCGPPSTRKYPEPAPL